MHCDIPICCKVGHWHFQSVRLRVCPSSSVLSLLSIIALILDLPSISAFVSHGQSLLGYILYSNHRTVLQWQSFGLSYTLYILAVKSYLIHWISSYCFIVLESVMQPWTFSFTIHIHCNYVVGVQLSLREHGKCFALCGYDKEFNMTTSSWEMGTN